MNSEANPQEDDPVVAEVRKAREEYAAEFGFDLRAIFDDLQKRQAASNVKYIMPPERPHVQAEKKAS